MSKLTYRSEKKVKWVSHTAAGKDPSGYISLGTAHTDEVRPGAVLQWCWYSALFLRPGGCPWMETGGT